MNIAVDSMVDDFLPQLKILPQKNNDLIKSSTGIYSRVDKRVGRGSHWIYEISNCCSFAMYDVMYFEDVSYKQVFSPQSVLSRCTSVVATPMMDCPLHKETVLVGYNTTTELCSYTIPKNTLARNICLGFGPDYYTNYLPSRYNVDFSDFTSACAQFNGFNDNAAINFILNKLATISPDDALGNAYFQTLADEVALLILQKHRGKTQQVTSYTSKDCEAIHEISYMLYNSLEKKHTLAKLAQSCYMSRSKFCTLFRQVTGASVGDYLTDLRIAQVKEILLNSDKSLGEISALVGYENQGSLSYVFHKKTGLTPSEFKRQNKS